MTFEELNAELQRLVGENVSYVRVAANSIIIYFFGEPGDGNVVSVFIDPTWRFERHGKVVVGSYDLQIDEPDFGSKEEYEEEFQRRAALPSTLEGAKLERVEIESESSDIRMKFSGNQIMRNFSNSAFEDKHWTYRNHAQDVTAYISSLGIKLLSKKE